MLLLLSLFLGVLTLALQGVLGHRWITFAGVFVGTIILCAFDFWWTKNVSGRLMVGLRYWNEVDDDNKSEWRFECRDEAGMARVHPTESRIFWYGLYLMPPAWFFLLFR